MNRVLDALCKVSADLDTIGAARALIGGLAVGVWADPRFTRDVDLAVSVSGDTEAEDIVFRLQALDYQVRSVIEQDATGRIASVRLLPPAPFTEFVIVDLLFASSGIETEVVREALVMEVVPGYRERVARAGHLIAMKTLSADPLRRPVDIQDILALAAEADTDEMASARAALTLIQTRGYHRGKELHVFLDQLLKANE